MANAWFRMYSEFATDPKVQMMNEAMQRRFVMLLCLQCGNVLATLHATERETAVAFSLRISEEECAETKELFLRKELINEDWSIAKWDQRQYSSDSSTERSRKHRENKKKEQATHATLQQRSGNALEQIQNRTEEEKDKKETGASAEAPAPLPAKNSKITFRKWLESLKAKGEQPIPADDPVFAYATDADLPNEFLGLAWREFRARYLSEEKRYVDWRVVFRKAVRSNWLGLWYCEGTQGYLLTSKGLQAQKAAQAAREAA